MDRVHRIHHFTGVGGRARGEVRMDRVHRIHDFTGVGGESEGTWAEMREFTEFIISQG